MEFSLARVIISILNLALLCAVIFGLYMAIKGFRNLIIRNNEMDKKIDIILNKLENKEQRYTE